MAVAVATRWYTRWRSPVAPLLFVAGADGALSGLWLVPDDDGDGPPHDAADARRDDAPFREALVQLEGYFAGERTVFELELRLDGTPFQRRVWAALQEIPYGTTPSYG